ncbi:tetratricopeptide repeat protein [Frateuria aurantia]
MTIRTIALALMLGVFAEFGLNDRVLAVEPPADAMAVASIDQALAQAQSRHLPVFVDFGAAWCHSCFAMRDHVLHGSRWEAFKKRFVLVESDADSDNGSSWMDRLKVPTLPTYVILNPDGTERGRIIGELPPEKFFQSLDMILSDAGSPVQRQARAQQGSMSDIAAIAQDDIDRFKDKDGMVWYQQLPAKVRVKAASDPVAGPVVALLQMRALGAQLGDVSARGGVVGTLRTLCRQQAEKALSFPSLGLRRFEAVRGLATCVAGLPLKQRRAILGPQLPALNTLLSRRVFGRDAGMVDLLDYTSKMEWIYQVMEAPTRVLEVQQAAIAAARGLLDDGHGGIDVRRNRSVAENLQIILDHAGEQAQRLQVLKALAAAYPDEYYYLNQYGAALVRAGEPAQALPFLERATRLAPSGQQMDVAEQHTRALMLLHRPQDAKAVVDAILKAHPHPKPGPETYELDRLKKMLEP